MSCVIRICSSGHNFSGRHFARALQALRDAAKEAAERLASDCPQQVPAALSARLEAVEQGIDVALAAFATLQPAMQSFYGALDDEQKARRDSSAT